MRSVAIITSQAFSLVNFRGPLIQSFVKRGIEVFALAPDFSDATRQGVISLGAKPVDYSLSRAGMNPLCDAVDMFRLRRLLRALATDATLTYFIKPVVYGSLAARLAHIPLRFSLIEGLGYVFADHAGPFSLRRWLLRAVVLRFYRTALRSNQKVFFLNADDMNLFAAKGLVAVDQVARIDGIGVDLNRYAPVAPVSVPVTFLLAARMLREKGVFDFAEAARKIRIRFPRTRFLLVGSTDVNPGSVKESQLRRWVTEGLLEWPGHVDDVRPWIAQASVFVLPSYYREGIPRSNQEAMAMGRPIITTDCVGCRETVQHGINGYLVPARDPDALAQAMGRFIESPELISKMGAESRRIAEQRFNVHVINEQIMQAMGL